MKEAQRKCAYKKGFKEKELNKRGLKENRGPNS
jgi:hypothetical protein